MPAGKDANPANRPWELYNLNTDYSQAHNLANEYPVKLKEMIQLFDGEAKRNQVYPLLPPRAPMPSPAAGRSVFVYRDGVDRLTEGVLPPIAGRAHEITADVTVGPSDANGVIITRGGRYGGFALFVRDGYVVYEINAFGNRAGQLVSRDKLKPGASKIVVTVEPNAQSSPPELRSGKVRLQVNGVFEGEAEFSNLIGTQHGETLDIGKDLGTAVSTDYRVPNPFNGKISLVEVELK
jgi:arylsulfatase